MKGCDVMPNWTHNKIICKKSIAEKLLTPVEDTYVLDFNKLIPMPNELDLTCGTIEDMSVACYYYSLDSNERKKVKDLLFNTKTDFYHNYWNKYSNDINRLLNGSLNINEISNNYDSSDDKMKEKYSNIYDLGKRYVDNIKDYGFPNWYDWRIENWGTKWNVDDEVSVIDIDEDNYEIRFDTAWSLPYGIMLKFSELCNDNEFHWEFQNEDFDGYHTLSKENGKIIDNVTGYDEEYTNDDIEI